MAVTPTLVIVPAVAPDPGTQPIDNTQVVTAAGLANRQVNSVGDPEDPDARAAVKAALPGKTAYGQVVRQAQPLVDVISTLLADSFGALTGATCNVIGIVLINVTSENQQVDITDGNDVPYAVSCPLLPNEVKPIPFFGLTFAGGVKAKAGVANAVRAAVKAEA